MCSYAMLCYLLSKMHMIPQKTSSHVVMQEGIFHLDIIVSRSRMLPVLFLVSSFVRATAQTFRIRDVMITLRK
jgi:hypothetical protein